jgi:hypothetical protein
MAQEVHIPTANKWPTHQVMIYQYLFCSETAKLFCQLFCSKTVKLFCSKIGWKTDNIFPSLFLKLFCM